MPDPQMLLDNAVKQFHDKNDTIGIAAVLWYDGNAYYKNLGDNDAGGSPVSDQSVFQLQSVQKVFTGLLFAGQVVQHRMQLKCVPFLKYLLDTNIFLQEPKWILQVQPWELATHTANFPYNIAKQPAQNLYAGKQPPAELMGWWGNFAPTNNTILGCTWAYSDLGVLSLGYATAAAAGQTYPDLLQTFIKKPWDMPNTWLDMNDAPADLRVTGYINGKAQGPVLGVKSCAKDLLSFVKHHLKLVAMEPEHEASVDLVLQPLWHGEKTQAMGICWQITEHPENPQYTLYAKDGGGSGFSTWVGLLPGAKCGVVFLANSQGKGMPWLTVGKELFSELFATEMGQDAEALCDPLASEAEQSAP